MMLSEIPVTVRAQAAWHLIFHGAEPWSTFAAAVWPKEVGVPDRQMYVVGLCGRGHPWTEENTYIRPNGHKKCRACENLRKRGKLPPIHRQKRMGRRDAWCYLCNEPCYVNRRGGPNRCRTCMEAQKRRTK